ncbi:DNA-processing protein DprA [Sedimentibacter sp.]|uniref:DNA-processing protein DprA n=1 Tax=Sedimentibacter sp. TaxID=1960295 RepID=UPI00289F1649|nr:DNA-processing protein DprA [Sedimentibacter sp.]
MISNEDIIKLQLIDGFGRKSISKILSYIDSKNLKLNNFSEIVKLLDSIGVKKVHIDTLRIEEDALNIIESCKKAKLKIIGIYDKKYPHKLRAIEDRPLLLYVDGDERLLNQDNNIAIVGTRNPTQEGYEISSIFAEKLTEERCCIISGLASGCDEAAHYGCLQASGKTVAVIPSGHLYARRVNKVLYNRIILSGGAIVSELPPDLKSQSYTFIDRNRIIAAVSDGVIVIEGGQKGGTSHTVRFASSYNKPVAYTACNNPNTVQASLSNDNISVIDSFEKLIEFKNKICENGA